MQELVKISLCIIKNKIYHLHQYLIGRLIGPYIFSLIINQTYHTCYLNILPLIFLGFVHMYNLKFNSIWLSSGTHICALTSDKKTYCWGSNLFGQLGIGVGSSTLQLNYPQTQVQGSYNFQSLALGENHTCGLTDTKQIYCWGDNEFGQLGVNLSKESLPYSTVPKLIQFASKFPTPIRFLSIGATKNSTCGVTESQQVYCWGDNINGQIGIGSIGGNYIAPQLISTKKLISLGSSMGNHICGIDESKQAYCWGSNDKGQVGIGTSETNQAAPTKVATYSAQNRDLRFSYITMGAEHTCGIDLKGYAYCWGDNTYGQLGNSNFGEIQTLPIAPVSTTQDKHTYDIVWNSISAGDWHTCGISQLDNGTYCFGRGSRGQLGINSRFNESSPVLVTPSSK